MQRPVRPANPAAIALAMLCATACLSSDALTSLWPPPDYRVEVRYTDGQREHRRVRIAGDGLVVYGIARRQVTAVDDDALQLPVFSAVCAYRLMPQSIRHLSRLLEQTGIYDQRRADADGGSPGGELVVLQWRGWTNERTLIARSGADSEVVRALHVINAFLPEDRPIRLTEMSGEPQQRRVDNTPDLVDDAGGALQLHLDLLEDQPRDPDLLVDAFALAVDLDRSETAEDLLARIEDLTPEEVENGTRAGAAVGDGTLAGLLRGFLRKR